MVDKVRGRGDNSIGRVAEVEGKRVGKGVLGGRGGV